MKNIILAFLAFGSMNAFAGYPDLLCTTAVLNTSSGKNEVIYQKLEITDGGTGQVQTIYNQEKVPGFWSKGDYYLQLLGAVNYDGSETINAKIHKTSRDDAGNYVELDLTTNKTAKIGESIVFDLNDPKIELIFGCMKIKP
jgi:hypothetical protein